MIETHIKILSTLYTAVLMGTLTFLLFFGGFTFKAPSIKGKAIEAVMIDVSQLNKSTSKKAQPTKKVQQKSNRPVKKDPPKKQPPQQKPPVKKEPPKKTPVKKDPPRIVKKTPKVDTKAQELERQKRIERQKKLEDIRKKRIAAEQKRKREEQALKDLVQQTQNEINDQTTSQIVGSKKGHSEADEHNKMMSQYQAAVISSVEGQWNKPASANPNLLCYVKVRQIPGGGVVDATISTPCNANTIVKNSIIAAIKKADPLPYKGFEKVFSRTATFIFEPKNQ